MCQAEIARALSVVALEARSIQQYSNVCYDIVHSANEQQRGMEFNFVRLRHMLLDLCTGNAAICALPWWPVLKKTIGVIDPQFWAGWPWEFEAISNRLVGQHNFNRVAKTIFRMAAIWGLESLASNWRSPKCLMFVMPPKPLQMILRRSGHFRTVAKDCMFWKGNLKSWVTKEPRPVMRSAWPMTVSGIHYALVEGGGFMSCLGFSHD